MQTVSLVCASLILRTLAVPKPLPAINDHVDNLFKNENIPEWLLFLGIVAQILFTLRFVYQWIYSEKSKNSVLPMGFWMISLSGSILIFIYAIIRRDPVLLVGHAMGLVIYTRNIFILRKNVKINS